MLLYPGYTVATPRMSVLAVDTARHGCQRPLWARVLAVTPLRLLEEP